MADYSEIWLAVPAAMLAGVLLALIFGMLVISFRAHQVAVGLAVTIFGTSFGSFLGKSYVGVALLPQTSLLKDLASRIPLLGDLLGQLHPLVWLSWALFASIWFFVYRNSSWLILRAVGESRSSAHALGYPVVPIRYLATLFGGALAGIAGAYISIVYTSLWTEGLIAGRGWIADVQSGSPNTPVQGLAAEEKGVWSIGNTGDFSKYVKRKQLVSYELDWSAAHINAAKSVMDGTWKPEGTWLGLGERGYVKMTTSSPDLPEPVAAEMKAAEEAIIAKKLKPFAGLLKDQAGNLKVAAGQELADNDIKGMTWLVEGVQGTLPQN